MPFLHDHEDPDHEHSGSCRWVHLVFDGPLPPIQIVWPTEPLQVIVTQATTSGATKAVLSVGGPSMPGTLTVDSNSNALLNYEDDHADPTAAPADAANVALTSDNSAVATIGAAVSTPTGFSAPVTFVSAGSFNLGVTGTLGTEKDGTTPIPTPAPVAVNVAPGPANSAALSLA